MQENYNAKDSSKMKWAILWPRGLTLATAPPDAYRGPVQLSTSGVSPKGGSVWKRLFRAGSRHQTGCCGGQRAEAFGRQAAKHLAVSCLWALCPLLCKVEANQSEYVAWKAQAMAGILEAKHNRNSSESRYKLCDSMFYLSWLVFLKSWLSFNKMAGLMVALLRTAVKVTKQACSWAMSQPMPCTRLARMGLHQTPALPSCKQEVLG